MKLDNETAIVTGGASGLGEATARELAAQGARVAIWDLNEALGSAVAESIGGKFYTVDVSDESSVKAALASMKEDLGVARVLVSCAGIGPAEKIAGRRGAHNLDNFERVIKVNLVGTFNCARLAAQEMLALEPYEDGERGVIINTSSGAAFEGQIGQVAYAASKGAVASMTIPIARDLMDVGIRCVAIAPGLFRTPLIAGMPEPVVAAMEEKIPFPKRLGQPEEFASLVREVCTNRMMNGATVRLDAAYRLQPK